MNENLNLVEILKDCPIGTKLYSTTHGDVKLELIDDHKSHPIIVRICDGYKECFSADGKMYSFYGGECILFPSREQRDWSKFKVKKPKFDPKTLQPFDKVLVRNESKYVWDCHLFSYIKPESEIYKYCTLYFVYKYCIPYNDDTKHLVGTTEEAPEYYRYWED